MSSTGLVRYNMRTVVQATPGAIITLPSLFEGLGASRVVLLSDAGLQDAGIVEQVANTFRSNSSGVNPTLAGVFTEIAANSSCETVNAALRYVREVGADAILAVGGGSVLDAAKGVKYAMHNRISDIREVLQGGIKLESWPQAKPIEIPHIAVPTTAGTGAEVSAAAVFYNEDLGVKCNLVVPYIEADIAVLDANLTLGLPPCLTASTGMDALTHALEALASPAATHFTDSHATTAAQLIESRLPLVIENGRDVQARHDLLQASTLAIDAFVNALNAIPVHNCAHAFGGLYHIPHGDANSVLLPIVMEVLSDFYLPHAARLAAALNLETHGVEAETLLANVIASLRNLQEKTGCMTTFAKYEIPAEDLPKIVMAVATDPAGMFYPIPPAAIEQIVRQAIG